MENYEDLKSEANYLLREREFIIANLNIYKVGQTRQVGISRIKEYPKGSELWCFEKVKNCILMEKKIIELFKTKYKPTKFGSEYFMGDVKLMRKDIHKLIYEEEEREDGEIELEQAKEEINILSKEEIIQNIISDFVRERIIKTENNKDRINKSELPCQYRIWHYESQGSRKCPKGQELYEYMNKKFGQCKSTGWHGVKIVYPEEEEDDVIADL